MTAADGFSGENLPLQDKLCNFNYLSAVNRCQSLLQKCKTVIRIPAIQDEKGYSLDFLRIPYFFSLR